MFFARIEKRLSDPFSALKSSGTIQEFVSKAALGSLLLGGVVLSGGSAQAAQCTFEGNALSCLSAITLGDKVFSDFVWELEDGDTDASTIFGTIEFKWNEIGAPGFADDIWTVDVDLNEGDPADPDNADDVVGPAKGKFAYRVDIVDPLGAGWQFESAEHNALKAFGALSSVKLVTYDGGIEELEAPSSGGSSGVRPISGKFIDVVDTWEVKTGTDSIDSFTNAFTQKREEVPGPLPLLGAGAAFGFSRRLRSRIKGSRLA